MASTREEDMMRMQRMLDPGSVASPSEKLYMERVNRLKELDPGSVAREGETAIMNRVFGSGGAVNPQVLDPRSVARQGEVMGGARNFDPRSVVREGEEMVRKYSFDPNSAVREGEMAQENIPANRDMGMNSMMPQTLDPRSVVREGEMSIEEKLDILMRMGLSQDEAIEAIALENSLPATNPSEFGGARSEGEMGALSGVPTGGAMMPAPIPRPMQNPNSLERMRMEGRDRSFNPMDSIRPDNTPNT